MCDGVMFEYVVIICVYVYILCVFVVVWGCGVVRCVSSLCVVCWTNSVCSISLFVLIWMVVCVSCYCV